MDKAELARLAFWALNMTAATGGRNAWPGFHYTSSEWARLRELADAVEGRALTRYLLLCCAAFLVVAGAAVTGLFLPALLLLYPDPSDLQPLPFVLLLAATALLLIGIGLPLAMRFAAWASTDAAVRARLKEALGDRALAAKATRQIVRMAVITCGIAMPALLLGVVFKIEAGPWTAMLKWLGFGVIVLSTAHAIITRNR